MMKCNKIIMSLSILSLLTACVQDDKIEYIKIKEPYVLEWGEELKNEMFFTIKNDENKEQVKATFNYDEHKLDVEQNMKILVYIDDVEKSSKSVKVLIKDTKNPMIEYTGNTEIALRSDFHVKDYIVAFDWMGEHKIGLSYQDNLINRSYSYTVYKDDALLNDVDTDLLGEQVVNIYAKDEHGNMSTKKIILNIVEK